MYIQSKYNTFKFNTDYLYSNYNLKDFVKENINYIGDMILI
jgi:hypothetical protein